MGKQKKKEAGITLVALVITIIVMLILAAVSIIGVIGDQGILTEARNAVIATDVAETYERILINLVGRYDSYGNYTISDVYEAAKEVTGNDAYENSNGVVVALSEKGNEVDLSELIADATADTTAPSISLSVTKSGTKAVLTVTARDSSGIESYEYYLNGTSQGDPSTSTSYTYSGLSEGSTYTLKVVVTDTEGNAGDASVTITIDTTSPTISSFSATASYTSIAAKVTATDNVGIASYAYYINDVLKATTTDSTYTYSGLSEATEYTLKVIVTDTEGNTATATTTVTTNKTVVVTEWAYDDDGNITNGVLTLAIGDYVYYEPGEYTYTSSSSSNGYADQVFNTSSYTYYWRVLGVDDDGQILITTDDLVGPDSGGYTNSTYNRTYFYMKGQSGYANCETELNNISAIFGHGTGATGARSITVEDINKITGYDPDTAKYNSGSNVNQWGNEVTYAKSSSDSYIYYQGTKYPTSSTKSSYSSFTYYNRSNWITLSSGESVTLTHDYYYYYPNTLTTSSSGTTAGIETTSTEYYMLFTNSSKGAYTAGANSTSGFYYWLGSPYVYADTGSVTFGCRNVASGGVRGSTLYRSSGNTYSNDAGVRPVVSLSSDVTFTGSSEAMWYIDY